MTTRRWKRNQNSMNAGTISVYTLIIYILFDISLIRLPSSRSGCPDSATKRLIIQYLCQNALPNATFALLDSWGANATNHMSPIPMSPIALSRSSSNGSNGTNGNYKTKQADELPIALSQGANIFLREMPHVTSGLKHNDTLPAENWIFQHRMQLGRVLTYNLTFEITRIRFMQLLKRPFSDENLQQLLRFAEENLSVFYDKYEEEIRYLLLELLTYGKSRTSEQLNIEPVSPTGNKVKGLRQLEFYLLQLQKNILTYCSKINGLPCCGSYSNLEILLNVGRSAQPIVNTALRFVEPKPDKFTPAPNTTLGNISDDQNNVNNIKRCKNLFDLESSGLPVDFKIKPDNRYHSVFCCPVSRQPSTEMDPPVLLTCVHAILMSSMKSLPRRQNKFKCPTCYGFSEESAVLPLKI